MRRSRVDTNQPEIIEALQSLGWAVQSLTGVGNGCPDLAASRGGQTVWIEVKQPDGGLRESQRVWHNWWKAPVYVVRSADEIMELFA
jgi:hypothetical protein